MPAQNTNSTQEPRNAESHSSVPALSGFTINTVLPLGQAVISPPQTPPRINVRLDDLPSSELRGQPASQRPTPAATPDRLISTQIVSQSGTPWSDRYRRVQAAAMHFIVPTGVEGRLTTEIEELNEAVAQGVDVPPSVIEVMRNQARQNLLELLSGPELDTETTNSTTPNVTMSIG